MPSIVDAPDGFKGHGAAGDFAFARKFGPCIQAFIDTGQQAARPVRAHSAMACTSRH